LYGVLQCSTIWWTVKTVLILQIHRFVVTVMILTRVRFRYWADINSQSKHSTRWLQRNNQSNDDRSIDRARAIQQDSIHKEQKNDLRYTTDDVVGDRHRDDESDFDKY